MTKFHEQVRIDAMHHIDREIERHGGVIPWQISQARKSMLTIERMMKAYIRTARETTTDGYRETALENIRWCIREWKRLHRTVIELRRSK